MAKLARYLHSNKTVTHTNRAPEQPDHFTCKQPKHKNNTAVHKKDYCHILLTKGSARYSRNGIKAIFSTDWKLRNIIRQHIPSDNPEVY